MEEMPKNKISVTQLCERTGISRGTFYIHFETIDDVWKDIENDLFQDADRIMSTVINESIDPEKYIVYQKETDIWSKIYFDPNMSMELFDALLEHNVEKMQEYIPHGKLTAEEERVYLHFVLGGCIAVEKDRYKNPWKHFQKTNDFYKRMTKKLLIATLGKTVVKEK